MKRLIINKPKLDNNSSKNETSSNNKAMKSMKSAKLLQSSSNKFRSSASFLSLEPSMNDKTLQVYKDDNFICIKDKYPKSRFHLLIIPLKNPKLTKVMDLIKLPNSLEFLNELKSISEKIVQDHLPTTLKEKAKEINYGFHSIQSMQPLHMHIISNDFQSDFLKNKKHWNSFTTPYFIHLNSLIKQLEIDKEYKNDLFNLDNKSKLEDYLKRDLTCHICKQIQRNMPSLKTHIQTHSN